ncbi:hypothetical protein [Methylopila turkensis]|uniref:Uncharacterized protein n=1 Tax=Methylopila turkensis TaxID=1437816 RepID=A0A9W6JIV0_9HYPH|nr:hypothetical protein [Methylopila turkensis]GLK78465.1 hypothetical protein GCM10008174_02060 [Methylopila turkensis]
MRKTAFILALAAMPFAAPAFAATDSLSTQQRNIAACNALADSYGVTGYARSGIVQRCFEQKTTAEHRAG